MLWCHERIQFYTGKNQHVIPQCRPSSLLTMLVQEWQQQLPNRIAGKKSRWSNVQHWKEDEIMNNHDPAYRKTIERGNMYLSISSRPFPLIAQYSLAIPITAFNSSCIWWYYQSLDDMLDTYSAISQSRLLLTWCPRTSKVMSPFDRLSPLYRDEVPLSPVLVYSIDFVFSPEVLKLWPKPWSQLYREPFFSFFLDEVFERATVSPRSAPASTTKATRPTKGWHLIE